MLEGEKGKRAGGASIYQPRREVGGSMRRIAPYGRSLINSGRRQSRIRAAEHDCRNRCAFLPTDPFLRSRTPSLIAPDAFERSRMSPDVAADSRIATLAAVRSFPSAAPPFRFSRSEKLELRRRRTGYWNDGARFFVISVRQVLI